MEEMHAYENLPLFGVGLALGLFLIALHGLLLWKAEPAQRFLKRFPRDPMSGQILMAVGLIWFWLLVAPENLGLFSALRMDFGEFNGAKPVLRIAVPVILVLVCMSIRDFLAVRALGLVCLMVGAPLLEAAFLKDPVSRLLIPIYAYAIITAALFWVGKPYLFRDWVNWACASRGRWRLLSLLGLGYGLAVVICAFAFWRGY